MWVFNFKLIWTRENCKEDAATPSTPPHCVLTKYKLYLSGDSGLDRSDMRNLPTCLTMPASSHLTHFETPTPLLFHHYNKVLQSVICSYLSFLDRNSLQTHPHCCGINISFIFLDEQYSWWVWPFACLKTRCLFQYLPGLRDLWTGMYEYEVSNPQTNAQVFSRDSAVAYLFKNVFHFCLCGECMCLGVHVHAETSVLCLMSSFSLLSNFFLRQSLPLNFHLVVGLA